ncbi:unnamed protein product [Rotaria sp. Silwood1]|nr:unnamed protein product [Rotaria sp. Silwood1]CAF0889904.1 unnamed protein product [Rotaria sp. Silwood1]CAF0903770.1 unnamed protein product [Rotaria sp. Silwood1]CAF3350638.1 unnamed protein product [Rotaria sp. Silwood1]CAF3373724.1 unnamed protein product [Rotaria sp. Silwood1]
MQRFIILCFLIYLIYGYPIDQNLKTYQIRQQRSIDLMNWKSADILFKRLYLNENRQNQIDARMKRSETPPELRPVEGPISIEQLPAMLAARNVKRYPYSQENDPAIIGR